MTVELVRDAFIDPFIVRNTGSKAYVIPAVLGNIYHKDISYTMRMKLSKLYF